MNDGCWLIAGIYCIGYSAILLFDQDRVWKWHVNGQKRMGLKEEMLRRTPEWERTQAMYGLFGLGAGILSLLAAIF